MSSTLKILSIDGGGIRGVFAAQFIKRFCEDAGINPTELHKYFDIICGTSIGGMMAIALSIGKTPDEILHFFKEKSPSIFAKSTVADVLGITNSTYQMNVLMSTPLIGFNENSDGSHSMYSKIPLKSAISEFIGSERLVREVQNKFFVTSWDYTRGRPVKISNISGKEPYLIGNNFTLADACLATSAAPIYFPRHNIEGTTYIDGGVMQNNPSLAALLIGYNTLPQRRRVCLLSVGTSYTMENNLEDDASTITENSKESLLDWSSTLNESNNKVTSLLELIDNADYDKLKELFDKLFKEKIIKNKISKEKLKSILTSMTDNNKEELKNIVGAIFSLPYNVSYTLYLIENVFTTGVQNVTDDDLKFYSDSIYNSINLFKFQHKISEKEFEDNNNIARLDEFKNYDSLIEMADTQYGRDQNAINAFISHLKSDL